MVMLEGREGDSDDGVGKASQQGPGFQEGDRPWAVAVVATL